VATIIGSPLIIVSASRRLLPILVLSYLHS
jgi:hypothetical protein